MLIHTSDVQGILTAARVRMIYFAQLNLVSLVKFV